MRAKFPLEVNANKSRWQLFWIHFRKSWMLYAMVLLPLAYLMVHLMRSPDAIYWSQLCAWTFGMVYSYYLYRKGKWRAGL